MPGKEVEPTENPRPSQARPGGPRVSSTASSSWNYSSSVNAPATPIRFHPSPNARNPLEQRLRANFEGEVLFDAFSRGRYSTDASIYQIEPIGVPIPPRGAGTSQCGQTVGAALVIDCSKYLDEIIQIDADRREATVQPGVVLDQLNARLRSHKLW